jgi:hypothetical protein
MKKLGLTTPSARIWAGMGIFTRVAYLPAVLSANRMMTMMMMFIGTEL